MHQFSTIKHRKIIYTKNLNNVDIKQRIFELFETMIKETFKIMIKALQ